MTNPDPWARRRGRIFEIQLGSELVEACAGHPTPKTGRDGRSRPSGLVIRAEILIDLGVL